MDQDRNYRVARFYNRDQAPYDVVDQLTLEEAIRVKNEALGWLSYCNARDCTYRVQVFIGGVWMDRP